MKRTVTSFGGYRVHAIHDGAGRHVVLLHGLVGSSRWWRYTVPGLAPHFAVHAPDLIGFGRSRGTQPSIPEMARIVRDWMERSGIERAHVVGHSMGGQIAIHMAAEHAHIVDRLVLVDAAGIPRELSFQRATRFVAEIMPPRAWGAPRFLPTIAADALRAGPRVFARATVNLLNDDVRPLLGQITAPTLVIWGELDPLTPLRDGREIAAGIPGARLNVYANAAHMPMIDQPVRFNSDVLSFLRYA